MRNCWKKALKETNPAGCGAISVGKSGLTDLG